MSETVLASSPPLPPTPIHRRRRPLVIVALLLLIGLGIALGTGMVGTYLWAAYHLRAAREAVERYHTHEALSHLQACLTVWPRDPETLFLAARAARRTGEFDWADHYLDQYQELRGKA